jgi:cephalosporin hydroxylase
VAARVAFRLLEAERKVLGPVLKADLQLISSVEAEIMAAEEALAHVLPGTPPAFSRVETGIAHGGSLIFYAGLCKAMGHGRVIVRRREIRPPNRSAIESHELFEYIEMVEGSSVSPEVLARVRASIGPSECALVIQDSNHTKDHVLAELRAYAPLVGAGSYLVPPTAAS